MKAKVLRGALSVSYHRWHVILWIRLRLPKWSRNRRDTATARTEPHRCSQRASGYFCDNDLSKAFVQPFKEYRASTEYWVHRYRDY